MKNYKETITLNRNSRGCYIIDTVKGCSACALHGGRGCYGDCYAKNIADRYGFNFLDVTTRKFDERTDQLYLFGFKDEKAVKLAEENYIAVGNKKYTLTTKKRNYSRTSGIV